MNSTRSSLLIRKAAQKKGCSDEYVKSIYEYSQQLEKNNFPILFSLRHICSVCEVEYGYMRSVVKRKVDPYITRSFRKRSGGRRRISVPNAILKKMQVWILKNILDQALEDDASMAFRKGVSIYDNAEIHCGALWLIKIDLEDFFHSVNEVSVYRVFRSFGYTSLLSLELTRIATRSHDKIFKSSKSNRTLKEYKLYKSSCEGCLPQGAPTSPKLANLVFRKQDEQIRKKCKEYGFEYTRYADDISISTSNSDVDIYLCERLRSEIFKILKAGSYVVNLKKLRIIKPGQRKIVTGLVVNDTVPRLPKELRFSIEFDLYQAQKRGVLNHVAHKGFYTVSGFKNHLGGMIRYCSSVDPAYGKKLLRKFESIDWENVLSIEYDATPAWKDYV